jgi:hypothetical protein
MSRGRPVSFMRNALTVAAVGRKLEKGGTQGRSPSRAAGAGSVTRQELAVLIFPLVLPTLLATLAGVLLLLTGVLALATLLPTLAGILVLLSALSRAILAGLVLILVHCVRSP